MLIHPIRIARGNRVDSLILINAVPNPPDWYFLFFRCRIFLPPGTVILHHAKPLFSGHYMPSGDFITPQKKSPSGAARAGGMA